MKLFLSIKVVIIFLTRMWVLCIWVWVWFISEKVLIFSCCYIHHTKCSGLHFCTSLEWKHHAHHISPLLFPSFPYVVNINRHSSSLHIHTCIPSYLRLFTFRCISFSRSWRHDKDHLLKISKPRHSDLQLSVLCRTVLVCDVARQGACQKK